LLLVGIPNKSKKLLCHLFLSLKTAEINWDSKVKSSIEIKMPEGTCILQWPSTLEKEQWIDKIQQCIQELIRNKT